MHGEVVVDSTGTPTASTTPSTNSKIKTRIWRNARTENGYFLDVSKIPNKTEQQHLQTLHQQYKASNFFGIKFLGKNAQRYIEVYPSDDILDRFVTEGVLYDFKQSKIQLFPCKAVDGEGKLIQLSLTDIPFLPKDQLLEELSKALGTFGKVLDLGLNYEQYMGWFMGTGYAILQQLPDVNYPTLHHSITWKTATGAEEFCHATFPDMATWCRYCHEEGHTKFECPKAMARIICYNCDNSGHRQDTCPKPKKGSFDRAFKKARKTPTTISSAEAAKSKWAPSYSKNSDVGKQPHQGQQQQHHDQQISTTSNDTATQVNSRITRSRSTDQTNAKDIKHMYEFEDTDDDDYMPSASESESEPEQMSDIEDTDDEVNNIQREQADHRAHINFDNSDRITNDIPTIAPSENYNAAALLHHQLL
ncbi:hypothetical protein MAM1_0515d10807 [Mucor ambiguus]|uniref:CCHC-type domain-containing protein n=1 Tax=Mucor ambiguus TaxID=91626 RepID=A0A0C9N962_9FUNG|nr:hypothetical protein MAM1_0515d10807 [Mucor ambiguus]